MADINGRNYTTPVAHGNNITGQPEKPVEKPVEKPIETEIKPDEPIVEPPKVEEAPAPKVEEPPKVEEAPKAEEPAKVEPTPVQPAPAPAQPAPDLNNIVKTATPAVAAVANSGGDKGKNNNFLKYGLIALAVAALIWLLAKLFKKKEKVVEKTNTPNEKKTTQEKTPEPEKEDKKPEPEKTEKMDGISVGYTFENNSSLMRPQDEADFRKQAKALVETFKKTGEFPQMVVVGSASKNGPKERNEQLGLERAGMQKQILVEAGYPADKLITKGISADASKLDSDGKDKHLASEGDRVGMFVAAGIPESVVNDYKKAAQEQGANVSKINTAKDGVIKLGEITENPQAVEKMVYAANTDKNISTVLKTQTSVTAEVNGKVEETMKANSALMATAGENRSEAVLKDVEAKKTGKENEKEILAPVNSLEEKPKETTQEKDAKEETKETKKEEAKVVKPEKENLKDKINEATATKENQKTTQKKAKENKSKVQ